MRISINIGKGDDDIAEFIQGKDNKQRFIRDLIRDEMKREEKRKEKEARTSWP